MTYDRSRVDPGDWQSAGAPSGRRPRTVPAAENAGRRSTSGGGLFAASSGDSRLRFAGLVLAAAGVLIVVCSFLTWASASDDELSLSVTGMGSVSFEASEARAQALGGSADVAAELDERGKAPGVFTALFGALLAGAAILMVINRYPGLGAAAGAVLALIAVFMSLEYLFAPGDAVLDGTGSTGIGYAGVGLWLVTLGAFVALAASGFGTITALRGRRRPLTESAAPRRRAESGARPSTQRRSAGETARDRSAEPVRGGPGQREFEPRYRDRPAPTVPPSPPRPDFRPQPGYRARQGGGDGSMGRRPPPATPGYRPTPPPRPLPNSYPTVNQPVGDRDRPPRAVPPGPVSPGRRQTGPIPPGGDGPPGQQRPPSRRAPAPRHTVQDEDGR
ncbi:hypothetical protein DFR67_11194 [Williamsia limnetica]|uniref:Uncharacterized protein n=1 Tax=Williamsia limnetica TaxID=882452 RepID=A0A318REJ1_WILLI|nr:hypothetical protein [Williamsia limnetica]PYE15019.1 hypothetical protein DFR67_11194 [Williamsia limnetica]